VDPSNFDLEVHGSVLSGVQDQAGPILAVFVSVFSSRHADVVGVQGDAATSGTRGSYPRTRSLATSPLSRGEIGPRLWTGKQAIRGGRSDSPLAAL